MKVLTCFTIICCALQHVNGVEYPEEWVDPADMFFASASKINGIVKTEEISAPVEEEIVSSTESSAVNTAQISNRQAAVPQPKYSDTNVCLHPFLRRFAAVLLNKIIDYSGNAELDSANLDIEVKLNSDDLFILRDYVNTCSDSPQEVVKVMENMIVGIEFHKEKAFIEKQFNMTVNDFMIYTIIILVATFFLVSESTSKVSWSRQFMRFIALCLVLSFVSTYIHELQKVKISMRQSLENVPERCVNAFYEKSIFENVAEGFRHYFSVNKNDDCIKYQESLSVDPLVMVPPTKIVAITLAKFLFEPLEHFGTSFGKIVSNTLQDLPITLWLPALVLFICFALCGILLLTIWLGYEWSINLPFWAGFRMGPTQKNEELIHLQLENKRLDQDNRKLQLLLNQNNERLKCLEHENSEQQKVLKIKNDLDTSKEEREELGKGDSNSGNSLPYPVEDVPLHPPLPQNHIKERVKNS